LAFLAPAIVERIAEGRQPTDLSAGSIDRSRRAPFKLASSKNCSASRIPA
jgi:hypothetical protein